MTRQRATHCRRGHPYTSESLQKSGRQQCIVCRRERRRLYNQRIHAMGAGAADERDRLGCFVIARNQVTGEFLHLQEYGFRGEALLAICAKIDRAGPDWKIVLYSTPASILRDLRTGHTKNAPEAFVLSRIGRLDLLERR